MEFFSKILEGVNGLILVKSVAILKEDDDFFYFDVNIFKKCLEDYSGKNGRLVLNSLRDLEFIVSEKNRFSKTINVNGKTKRVVVFKKKVHRVLEQLSKE